MRIRPRYVVGLLLAIMLADALALLVVAGEIGAVVTVALVVLTGILGTLLVRAEGRHTIRSVEQKLSTGELPTNELMDGGLLIAAGAFLLTPGLATDAVGFLLAFPVTRIPIREGLKRGVIVPYLDQRTGGLASGDIWTSGFPGGSTTDGGSAGTTPGESSRHASDDVIDVDSDSYRVDESGGEDEAGGTDPDGRGDGIR